MVALFMIIFNLFNIGSELDDNYTSIYDSFGRHLTKIKAESSESVIILFDKEKIKHIRKCKKKGGEVIIEKYGKRIYTSKYVLREVLEVLKRTQKNGGSREETSVVLNDKTVLQGRTGDYPTIEKGWSIAEIKIPPLPEGKTNTDVEATIHSHPIEPILQNGEVYMYTENVLSQADRIAFPFFKLNIVISPLGRVNSLPGSMVLSNRTIGAVFYTRSATKIGSISIQAIESILKSE